MIFDISPEIGDSLAIWPGDVRPVRKVQLEIESGDRVTLSALTTTVHAGAHADAPSHLVPGGQTIDVVALEPYIGPCSLVRIDGHEGPLETRHLPADLMAERVLFAAGGAGRSGEFPTDFAYLSPELVEELHRRGTWLVGIDTPGIDPYDSEQMPAHHACVRLGIAILEGLVLDGVPEGVYELVALPLRLAGFDASPVRAILRTLDGPGTESSRSGSR
jgi:arylformamidase